MATIAEEKAAAERAVKEAAAIEAAAKQEHEKKVKAAEAAEKKRLQQEEAARKKAEQEREQEERRRAKEAAENEERRLAAQLANIANLSEEDAAALNAQVRSQAIAVRIADLENDFARDAGQQIDAFWAAIDRANEQRFEAEAKVDERISKRQVALDNEQTKLNEQYDVLTSLQQRFENESNETKREKLRR